MKDTIIIHSIHDKTSRDFVAAYGNRNDVTVLEDDGYSVRLTFPYISAFPTVVIPTPSYTESFISTDGGVEAIVDTNGGGAFVNLDLNDNEVVVSADVEYIRCPKDWSEVEARINYWENKVPNWKQVDSRYL